MISTHIDKFGVLIITVLLHKQWKRELMPVFYSKNKDRLFE